MHHRRNRNDSDRQEKDVIEQGSIGFKGSPGIAVLAEHPLEDDPDQRHIFKPE